MTIPKDKLLHFAVGAAVGVAAGGCGLAIAGPYGGIAGPLAALLAGAGKEIKDKRDYGVFDIADLAATVAGGVLSTLLAATIL
jgi:hypothetical protein